MGGEAQNWSRFTGWYFWSNALLAVFCAGCRWPMLGSAAFLVSVCFCADPTRTHTLEQMMARALVAGGPNT